VPITNITYVTTGATGATFAGLPAGVAGVWAAGTATISGIPTVSGTFNYTVTLTGGCGFVTGGGTINVTPDNTIVLTSAVGTDNQTACINAPVVNITYSTTGATGATITGLPAGVTGSWAADVVTISGSPTVSGTFNFTVTLTGGCGNVTTAGTMIIDPDNTVALTSAAGTDNQTICVNTPIALITYATTGATGATVTGLPAGVTGVWAAGVVTLSGTPSVSGPFSYTVTLTGGCGVVTSTGTITVSAVPVLVVTDPAAVCSPSTVDLTAASVTAGSDPGLTLTYWTDALATIPYLTPSTASAGTYYIKGSDAAGCFDIKPVNVTVNASPTASVVVTDVLCFGGNTGAVDLTVVGGTAPYTYLWSNSATTEDISGLVVGSYNVTVTDASGCTATASAIVNEPLAALAGSTVVTNVSCTGGGSDGAIDLTVTGGTGPYTFLWSNGATTEDISGLTIANYTVVITDANGCTANSSGNVLGSATAISGSTAVTDVSCFGGNTGAVDLTVTGGTAPYIYVWSNGATTEDISGLTAGTYTVLITDAGGCTANASGTVAEPAVALSGTTVVTNVLCFGNSTGAVNLTVTGGTAPYTFLWNTGATTEDLVNIASANYTVTITDSKGCTAVATGSVTQPAAALSGATVITNVLCNGGTSGAIDLATAGGTAPYTFLWSNGAATEDISGLSAGSYSVKITDANSCFITVNADITQPAKLVVEETHTDAKCPDELNGSITITVSGGVSPYGIFWSDGVTTSTRAARDTVYSVVVTDANGCAESLDVTVGFTEGSTCVMVPAIITPNGDGKNDTWIIKNIDLYPNAEVLVYNRWGKTIFKTKNILANPWDGTFNGKVVATDSYHYILYLNDPEGSKPREGVITVIR
jgi:gliding motility-associated-like protein